MASEPVSAEVATALGAFFGAEGSPSHRELDEIFDRTNLDKFDPKPRDDLGPRVGKERRVRTVLSKASGEPGARGRDCVLQLLGSLRARSCFVGASESYVGPDRIESAQRAFSNLGWQLDNNGRLGPLVLSDIDSASRRPVIELQINRMRNAPQDAALLIGTAKELLETTAKYVVEELGQPARDRAEFSEVLYLARERLGIHPKQVRAATDAERTLQKVYQSLWSVAEATDDLRNLEGIGHGSTHVPSISAQAARSVVQAASIMAQLMLSSLDSQKGS